MPEAHIAFEKNPAVVRPAVPQAVRSFGKLRKPASAGIVKRKKAADAAHRVRLGGLLGRLRVLLAEKLHGVAQALLKMHGGAVAEQGPGLADVGQ